MTQLRIENNKGELIKEVPIDVGRVLLSQLESHDIEIPNACRTGMCAACMCKIVSGSEHVIKNLRGEPAFPLGEDEVMTCIAGVKETDETIVLQTLYE
ncbi:(2Fe-2S)-binding protein [Candidatus Gracilibacteria bacterium]|nr:(2Fe-2S)-binding protein [Candidatus Gracilibacteria bacterium]